MWVDCGARVARRRWQAAAATAAVAAAAVRERDGKLVAVAREVATIMAAQAEAEAGMAQALAVLGEARAAAGARAAEEAAAAEGLRARVADLERDLAAVRARGACSGECFTGWSGARPGTATVCSAHDGAARAHSGRAGGASPRRAET